MRFGVFLSYNRIYPPEHYAGVPLHEERLAQAVEADRLGYDIIWIPEHHLIHFFQVPSAMVLMTQVGLNVQCKVGAMVVLPLYRHPLVTAGEVSLVDNILHGRIEIGLGRGAYAYEFERLGIPFEGAKDRFNEYVEALETIWHGPESVSFDGQFTSFASAHVWPRPYQEPHPPLWLAGMTAPTIEWAVRQGYHVSNWPFLWPMSEVEKVARVFHTTLADCGKQRGDQRLAILRGAWTGETKEEIERHIETVRRNNRIAQHLHHFTQNADSRAYVAPNPVENEPTPEETYENLIWGTPEECFEKVSRYDDLGVDDLLLMFDFGAPHEHVMDAMRVFAERVMKPYRERHGHDGTVKTSACPLSGGPPSPPLDRMERDPAPRS